MENNHLNNHVVYQQPIAIQSSGKYPTPLLCKCWSQNHYIVLSLSEQLNKQAFTLWKKSMDNLSPHDVTPQSSQVWVNPIIIPPPNSHFVSTKKSVGLYSALYGNFKFFPNREMCTQGWMVVSLKNSTARLSTRDLEGHSLHKLYPTSRMEVMSLCILF